MVLETILQNLSQGNETYISVFLCVLRYLAPALAGILLWRCLKPLVAFKREPEIWGWLTGADGSRFALTHWENIIGRSKSCDICIDFPTISRNHAVLTRYDDGSWTITDAGSKSGVQVNGQSVRIHALDPNDVINIGGLDMNLTPITALQKNLQAKLRTHSSVLVNVANLLLLTLFQLLVGLAFLLTVKSEYLMSVLWGFGGIAVCQWALMIFYLCIRRSVPRFKAWNFCIGFHSVPIHTIRGLHNGMGCFRFIVVSTVVPHCLSIGSGCGNLAYTNRAKHGSCLCTGERLHNLSGFIGSTGEVGCAVKLARSCATCHLIPLRTVRRGNNGVCAFRLIKLSGIVHIYRCRLSISSG